MKLNLFKRLFLLQHVPQQGSMSEMRAAKRIIKQLEITEEEREEFNVRQEGQSLMWNEGGEDEREFDLSPEEITLIKEMVKTADDDKKITMQAIDFAEEIMEL